MVKSSPGIIIVASKSANIRFLPLNSSLANANAESIITVNSKEYKQLGMFYILMSQATKSTVDIELSVTDTNSEVIRSGVSIDFIPIQRNYKTNVVGGLLTGSVKYNISIEDAFANDEHKMELN